MGVEGKIPCSSSRRRIRYSAQATEALLYSRPSGKTGSSDKVNMRHRRKQLSAQCKDVRHKSPCKRQDSNPKPDHRRTCFWGYVKDVKPVTGRQVPRSRLIQACRARSRACTRHAHLEYHTHQHRQHSADDQPGSSNRQRTSWDSGRI